MPRDLRSERLAHAAMRDALRSAPKLGKFALAPARQRKQREKDLRVLRILFLLAIITVPTLLYIAA
jgi:hypothetical protein